MAQVIAQYGNTSFKRTVGKLEDQARNIADDYLHDQIDTKRGMPTETQVDFRAPMDVLLEHVAAQLRT